MIVEIPSILIHSSIWRVRIARAQVGEGARVEKYVSGRYTFWKYRVNYPEVTRLAQRHPYSTILLALNIDVV